MTRKEQRKNMIAAIKDAADWGDNGAIQTAVDIIEHEINSEDINLGEIRKWLNHIKECCITNHSQQERNHHAFNMVCDYALLIGEQYDPMY